MWEMYDAVLSQVQSDDRIQDVRAGDSWVMVKTEKGALGVAAAQSGRRGLPLQADMFIGMPLNEAVQLVKSWDYEEDADYTVLVDPDGNPFCVVQI